MSPKIRKGYLYSKAKSEAKSFSSLFFVAFFACLLAFFFRPRWPNIDSFELLGLLAIFFQITGEKKIAEFIRSLLLLARFSFLFFISAEKAYQDIQNNRSIYSSEIGEIIEELVVNYLDELSQVDLETDNKDLKGPVKTEILLAVLKCILIQVSAEQSESERE